MEETLAPEKALEKQQDSANVRDPSWMGQTNLPVPFGRLTLLKRLARGGMGEVYLAATRGIEGAERPCVVKTIREEHSTDKSFRARFLDETRIQAQLTHPGVAQILEAATLEDGRPYAVVEYIEGRHLGEVMQRSVQLGVRVGWADAVAIGIAFGDALTHVHERTDESGRPLEIAHRDLSPQNIMLGYAGDLKVIDFGTAKGENRRCRTVAGIVFAKPGYVAPEVANQIPGGPAADLYAFGVMLWELAAGRRFLQGDPIEHQARVASGEMRLPAIATKIGAPSRFDEFLQALTHPELEKRIPSARRAVTELSTLLKLAPSLADGDRSVRGRIAQLMLGLYPAEPARSRADFAKRVSEAREKLGKVAPSASLRAGIPEPSPQPPGPVELEAGMLQGTRYRLERCLSEGGMGEVWEATHVDLGRKVALKLLPPTMVTSPMLRQRFKAEARALARLSHPGLPKVHDFGIAADGRPFSAMELLSGTTLESKFAEGRLDWREAVRIARETLDALEVAHEAGVVHRDISPSNLFLVEDGSVRLLDFGVSSSKFESSEEKSREAPLSVGTPEYISPEQAAGGDPKPRSDLYAVGVVLYEALTGKLPHPLGEHGSPTLPALLTAKITIVPPAPSTFVEDKTYPRALDAVVLRLLERDAEKRYATAAETSHALARAARVSAPSPRNRMLLSAAAAFLLVLGGGAVWSKMGGSKSELGEVAKALEHEAVPASAPMETAEPASIGSATETRPGVKVAESPPITRELTPELKSKLEKALALGKKGQKIRAHHELRQLAKVAPDSLEVLRSLVRTAKGVSAWGEALKACQRIIVLGGTIDDRVELARLERATLSGDPKKTLESVLTEDPNHLQARELLEEYRKDRRLAAR